MAKHVDKFGAALQLKLNNIETSLRGLKSTIDSKAQHAEKEVRSHLDAVNKRIEQDRAKVTAAQTEVKNWLDEQKTATSEKIIEWKTKQETTKLLHHAEIAERTPMLRSTLRRRRWIMQSKRFSTLGPHERAQTSTNERLIPTPSAYSFRRVTPDRMRWAEIFSARRNDHHPGGARRRRRCVRNGFHMIDWRR